MYRKVAGQWNKADIVILSPAWSNFEIGLSVNTQYVQYLKIYHTHGRRICIWERFCIVICIILPIYMGMPALIVYPFTVPYYI